jgi:hypothetical protein
MEELMRILPTTVAAVFAVLLVSGCGTGEDAPATPNLTVVAGE